MTEYLATSTDLTAVADSIRNKTGESGTLTFPDDFISSVGAIPEGNYNVIQTTLKSGYDELSILDASDKIEIEGLTITEGGKYTAPTGKAYGVVQANITPGIDTSDATAIASDILSGKTAYAKGSKLTGTYVPLDTSDATAIASEIAADKTAYINGIKVTGTASWSYDATTKELTVPSWAITLE